MDDRRFDDLSRRLASGLSRRTVLRGAAAGLLGALGLRQQADAQVSQLYCGNQACASNPGSCKPGCVCCAYTNAVGQVINSRCRPPGTCSPGTEVGGSTTTTTTAAPATTTPAPTTTTTTAAPTTTTAQPTTTPAPTTSTTTTTATPKAPNGTACTAASQCVSGFCTDGVCCDVSCEGDCTSCAVAGHVGRCTAVANDTPCGTADLCINPGVCFFGVCFPGSPVACPQPPAGSCTQNVCRSSDGACISEPKPDGSSCDSGRTCRNNETCTGGVCGGGTSVVCNSPPECQRLPGLCVEGRGCTYQPLISDITQPTSCGAGGQGRCDPSGRCISCSPTGTVMCPNELVLYCCSRGCTSSDTDPDCCECS